MKKELLMGTALVSTLGAASVAEAVTATMSGNHQTGLEFDSPTGGTDTNAQTSDNNFTVSLSETTDGGMTISSSFKLMDEDAAPGDRDAGFTLAFTDGSKLDVLNAGNASGSHAVSIPGSAGSEGVATTSTNAAQTGLDFMTASTVQGIEYHTASDFLADGLKMSFSASTDSGAAAGATYRVDSHVAIGATYVTDLGDTALTIGGGYSAADGSKTETAATDSGGFHVGLSAVTGDLTVAVGFADGDKAGVNLASSDQIEGDVVKAGIKYVTGDLTFNVGLTTGDAKDTNINDASGGATDDSKDVTSASVSYAVASGVTAILGYTTMEASDEGASTDDGSAWYIGANMSF
ncbi:porin [Pelagibacteraceae bacterium]|nr:porin [Pelagibacteraceae bacterium]